MIKFDLGTLVLTPVNDFLPREEILARYPNLYVLFAKRDLDGNIGTINIGKPRQRYYDPIGSNCWALEQHDIIKYFIPVEDGPITYNTDKPIFRIESSDSMTVKESITIAGGTSLQDYMNGLIKIKRPKLVAETKTVVPITKEEKEIYDLEGWETLTLSEQNGLVDFATSENDTNSCYFGVVGEERINLFKQRDPERPILRLYVSSSEVLGSSPVWNTNSINEVINSKYGFNKTEKADVLKIG
ncbi:MAG: hypothetical protein IKQ35_04315 [Bacilli bacterium]|nr:hypothetical protein [Bacilli bacterium]